MIADIHTHRGIDARQFRPVIQALIYSLEEMLGPAFTPEVRHSWLQLYSHVMLRMAPQMKWPAAHLVQVQPAPAQEEEHSVQAQQAQEEDLAKAEQAK